MARASDATPEVESALAAGTPAVVAVACSGGPDSLALLHATWVQAQALGLTVLSLHVHHGLQAQADQWPAHIEAECRRWSRQHPQWAPIRCEMRRLQGHPAPGQSVEEWARVGRREALVDMARHRGATLVLLAQHRRDQAETFLLQALRGAGPQGLAGMAPVQWVEGVCLARPWLEQDPRAIQALVREQGLRPVQDPSNQDPRWARNRLRLQVWPALEAAFGSAPESLAKAARQCARALPVLEAGARADLQACLHPGEVLGGEGTVPGATASIRLDRASWAALTRERRAAVLRLWLAQCGLARPGAALIERVAAESVQTDAAQSARWPVPGGGEVRWYRGSLSWVSANARGKDAAPQDSREIGITWSRGGQRRMARWAGVLRLRRAQADEPGLPGPLPLHCVVVDRQPGQRFQRAAGTPARSLKKQFQQAGLAAWSRSGPVVCDNQGRLLFVSGLGLDARVCTTSGSRWVLEWVPDDPLN